MEFKRQNVDKTIKENIQVCVWLLFMSMVAILAVIEGIAKFNNYTISLLGYVGITIGILLVEASIMIYGILDIDRKVIIENNMISYYVRRPWGYRLIREISISDISSISELLIPKEISGAINIISKVSTGGGFNTSGLKDEHVYEILYEDGKKTFLKDMKTSNLNFFTNTEGIVLRDYLEANYFIKIEKVSVLKTKYSIGIVLFGVFVCWAIYDIIIHSINR